MRHLSISLILLTFLLTTSLHARGNLKDLTVPLKYVTQEDVHETSPDLPPGLLSTSVEIRVEDGRSLDDPLVIGHGTGGDDKTFPMHADRSPVAFVQESVASTAKDWRLTQTTTPARVLTLQLTRFDIDEANKALGSIYSAEVKFAFTLKDARGRTLADGAVSGSAHRYGHAHSPDNCNEVLSDALKEAFSNVLADAGLQHAWTSGQPGSVSSSGTVTTQESAEERLRKLDDVYKKGLISKEEYQQKRAEILKSM